MQSTTTSIPILTQFLTNIVTLLKGLGLIVFLIAIVIAGILRMASGNSERRVTASNIALTAAVVGLVIMLLDVAFQGFITANLNH